MKNMSAPDTENIFENENINAKLDLRKYNILPKIIKWNDISIDSTYDELLAQAQTLYHINNPPQSKHEKFVAKLTATPLIMDRFDKLEAKLELYYNEFLKEREVDEFLQSQDPMISDFGDNLQKILEKYIKKLHLIKKAWYEDWKDFGNMNDYTPIAAKIRKLPKANRANIVNDAKKIYQNLLNTTRGDERDNPLKYWIIHEVQPALDTTSRIGPDERPDIVNAEMYTPSLVLDQFNTYLQEIPKLPDNNLIAAYYKIEEILNWVSEFADINYTINSSYPYSFYERVDSLNIDEIFGLDIKRIKAYLKKIFNEFGTKLNTANLADFVTYMKLLNKKNKHFDNYNQVHEILFEIYAIRYNGNTNKANFNINSIVDGYREWQRTNKIEYPESYIEGGNGVWNTVKRMFTSPRDKKKKPKEDAEIDIEEKPEKYSRRPETVAVKRAKAAAVKKAKANEDEAKFGFDLFDGKLSDDELILDDEFDVGSIPSMHEKAELPEEYIGDPDEGLIFDF